MVKGIHAEPLLSSDCKSSGPAWSPLGSFLRGMQSTLISWLSEADAHVETWSVLAAGWVGSRRCHFWSAMDAAGQSLRRISVRVDKHKGSERSLLREAWNWLGISTRWASSLCFEAFCSSWPRLECSRGVVHRQVVGRRWCRRPTRRPSWSSPCRWFTLAPCK